MRIHIGGLGLALLLVAAGQSRAGCPGTCAIPGGGPRRTDCLVEFDGVTPTRPRAAKIRCTDGDASCDADGVANGSCHFRLTACLNNQDPRLPKCTPGGVASFSAHRSGRLAGLDAALRLEVAVTRSGLPSAASLCTAPVSVYVPLRGKRRYRAATTTLRTLARTTEGRRDVDKLRFTCRPSKTLRRPGATYARAKVITQAAELIEGPLSRGRLGDILLANDQLQVVIQQPGRAMFGIGTYGGNIIDGSTSRIPPTTPPSRS
jgi:hypothetical protein